MAPVSEHGKLVEIETNVTEVSLEKAINTYNRACARRLTLSSWKELSGVLSASFKSLGKDNQNPDRVVELYDYIIIDIPGPGPQIGKGYDWVSV